jgi:OTU domain-containing protein 6
MEDLLKKHRQEQRDLQARITQKKKNATKKTRKGVNDECEELERQLKERHHRELLAEAGEPGDSNDSTEQPPVDPDGELKDGTQPIEDAVSRLAISGDADQLPPSENGQPVQPEKTGQGKKTNRQKARLARRAAEQDAAAAQAASEAASQPDLREQERLVMQEQFKARKLKEKDIRPDGHCLYSAIADQLTVRGMSLTTDPLLLEQPPYKIVRHVTADFIAKNPDDFSAFLEEPLGEYVNKVRDTAEWGGQLELQALARAYTMNINVLQGDGRVERIEAPVDGAQEEPVWLAYYRHSYGLGEHYNSLRPAS